MHVEIRSRSMKTYEIFVGSSCEAEYNRSIFEFNNRPLVSEIQNNYQMWYLYIIRKSSRALVLRRNQTITSLSGARKILTNGSISDAVVIHAQRNAITALLGTMINGFRKNWNVVKFRWGNLWRYKLTEIWWTNIKKRRKVWSHKINQW